MPVNYLHIKNQLPDFCKGMKTHLLRMDSVIESAYQVLIEFSEKQSDAIDKVKSEIICNQFLRCALPVTEPMDQSFQLPDIQFKGVVLAADGSQILPSRQRQVNFSVINVGVIILQPGSGEAPETFRKSQLINYEDSENGSPILSEGYIALMRDLAERNELLDIAGKYASPVVTLTDGGLELYLDQRTTTEYDKALHEYHETLSGLEDIKAITAGYVDKPGSSFVMKMLDILAGSEVASRTDMGIDRLLFERILKDPFSRSAIFQIISQQNEHTDQSHVVHFFYLNTSQDSDAKIARIEIPGWVAENRTMVDTLHRVLIDQSSNMHPPFPYVLHRAHEEAVISLDEAARVEEMVIQELYLQNIAVGHKSGKQTHKDLSGRKRYQP